MNYEKYLLRNYNTSTLKQDIKTLFVLYEYGKKNIWNPYVLKNISLSFHYTPLYYNKLYIYIILFHIFPCVRFLPLTLVIFLCFPPFRAYYTLAFISILHGTWFGIDFTINIITEAQDFTAHIMSVARGDLKYNLTVWDEW